MIKFADHQTDLDAMECDERMSVIEDIEKANLHQASLLVVQELETHAGYIKLQLVMGGVPCTSINWPDLRNFVIKIFIKLIVFNQRILARYYYEANEIAADFIKFHWDTLDRIQHSETISEHTIQETQYALSFLLPHIYTCLDCNISAIAIRIPNPQSRDFLLLGTFIYFKKSCLSGCLKFMSVLYCAKLHKDCEWLLDHMDEEHIKSIPSYCTCRFIKNDSLIALGYGIRSSLLQVSTFVSFLPTELPITPDALVYEMFRFVGISIQK
ncbi:unnamed protein product [Mytilus edulis]|uniref:Uncharacterized protein n=1 Tax=Mytilus edulis TaxID=6550 RepID=A0A8S3U0P8_MYTED|nr:unnamed protein product [Mytilus edulis]